MKRFTMIFFTLISFNLLGQEINGRIIDSKSDLGIPYVTVFFPDIFKGTVTDSLGFFKLKNECDQKRVHISCIGYNDTIIKTENLYLNPIKLTRKNYLIKELIINNKGNIERIVGCSKKNPNSLTISMNKGMFIYFPKAINAKVNSIGLFIRKTSNSKAKLHFRLLEPDTTYKTFGKDKLAKTKVIEDIKIGWNEVDLKNENCNITKNGLIIYFYFTDLLDNELVTLGCSEDEPDYNCVSSNDYHKDFPFVISGKKHRPAIRMKIVE